MTVTVAGPTTTAPDRSPAPGAAAHADLLLDAARLVLEVLDGLADGHPEDPRPRAAVESVLGWLAGTCDDETVAAAGRAAHGAARAASTAASVSAARAAAQLAAATRSPGQLPHARRYAERARTARTLAARGD
jgi:hypothetical protein